MTVKEKKDYLNRYQGTKRQIERICIQINELRISKMFPSIKADDMPHGTACSDLSDYIVHISEKEEKLLDLLKEKETILDEIMEAVNNLEDEVEKDVIVYRYIRGFSWERVASEIQYSWKQTHRYHAKALESIELICHS